MRRHGDKVFVQLHGHRVVPGINRHPCAGLDPGVERAQHAHQARADVVAAHHQIKVLRRAINQLARAGLGTVKAKGRTLRRQLMGVPVHKQPHARATEYGKPALHSIKARKRSVLDHLGHRNAPIPVLRGRPRQQLARRPRAIAPGARCHVFKRKHLPVHAGELSCKAASRARVQRPLQGLQLAAHEYFLLGTKTSFFESLSSANGHQARRTCDLHQASLKFRLGVYVVKQMAPLVRAGRFTY